MILSLLKGVEYFGKSNSSEGRWVVKMQDQTFHFFWYKKEMEAFLESTKLPV